MRKFIMSRTAVGVAVVAMVLMALFIVDPVDADMHKKILKMGFKALKKAPVFPLVFPLPLPSHLPKLSHSHKSVWVSHGHTNRHDAEKLAWKLEKEYNKYVNLVEGLQAKWPKQAHKW